jgi:hypothetical protein
MVSEISFNCLSSSGVARPSFFLGGGGGGGEANAEGARPSRGVRGHFEI